MISRADEWQGTALAVLGDVMQERKRQVARYGHNEDLEYGTGPNVTWLGPEIDPALVMDAEAIERTFRVDYEMHEALEGKPTWLHLVREEIAEAFAEIDSDRLEEELIQVAALAVSWVEKIRNKRTEVDF